MTADESRLSLAILISIGLHALLLALLPVLRSSFSLPVPEPAPVEVDLVTLPRPVPPVRPAPPPPAAASAPAPKAEEAPPQPAPDLLPKNQIVSPPDAGEEKEPEDTRLLSDRNVSVKEEQVKRGDGGAKEQPRPESPPEESRSQPEKVEKAAPKPAPAARPAPPPKPAPKPRAQLASRPSLDQLLPKPGDLAMAGPAAEPDSRPGDSRVRSGRDFLARSDARSFSTQPGIRDFLPTVREGDITLLNTKASLFAPFVRRVANRVFDSVRIDFNQALRRGGLRPGRELAQIEAVMDRKGNLVNARVMDHEGNTGINADRALLRASAPDTFFDSNPPSGAEASDGNIHFVLFVDINVDTGLDPQGRSGFGASGVVGVGLM